MMFENDEESLKQKETYVLKLNKEAMDKLNEN